jgi:hypothetical protein
MSTHTQMVSSNIQRWWTRTCMYVCMYTYIRKHKHTQTHTHTCKYDAGDQDVLPIHIKRGCVGAKRERKKESARSRARERARTSSDNSKADSKAKGVHAIILHGGHSQHDVAQEARVHHLRHHHPAPMEGPIRPTEILKSNHDSNFLWQMPQCKSRV